MVFTNGNGKYIKRMVNPLGHRYTINKGNNNKSLKSVIRANKCIHGRKQCKNANDR